MPASRSPSCLALHGFTAGAADFTPLVQAVPDLPWPPPAQPRPPPEWRAAMQARRLHLPPAGLAASLRQFGQSSVDPVWDRLPELRLPVLLVAGAEAPAYIALAEAMRARLPSPEFLLLPGA